MSAALDLPMTLEAFLEWNSRQQAWYEFDGIRPVPMNGGSVRHGLIARNLWRLLLNGLDEGRFQMFGAGTGIQAGASVRYPDALIAGLESEERARLVPDPVTVFEVLSPSTASADRGEKKDNYRDAPSIERYAILEQDRMAAHVFERGAGDWVGQVLIGDTDLPLPEVGLTLRLRDIYRGIANQEGHDGS